MSNRKSHGSILLLFVIGFIFTAAASMWTADAEAAFIDNGDGTVTDSNTGLTWLKDAGCAFLNASNTQWEQALDKVNNLAADNPNNCGLSDGSEAGDWRLPNRRELWSLIDYVNHQPPGLPPFVSIIGLPTYWTSTTVFSDDSKAWTVTVGDNPANALGIISDQTLKTGSAFIWPVKGTTGGSAPVARTGQTEPYPDEGSGDDGDLQKGVAWPNPRFTINGTGDGNGTVTDNLTGFVWLRDAKCVRFGEDGVTWTQADSTANTLQAGQCGLDDGSSPGDWRLAGIRELESLVSAGAADPAVPDTVGDGGWTEGNPFKNVESDDYWSSTEVASTGRYYVANFLDGAVKEASGGLNNFGWAVRDFVICQGDIEPEDKPDRDVDGADLAVYIENFTPNDPQLVVFTRNFGKNVECPPNG